MALRGLSKKNGQYDINSLELLIIYSSNENFVTKFYKELRTLISPGSRARSRSPARRLGTLAGDSVYEDPLSDTWVTVFGYVSVVLSVCLSVFLSTYLV